MNCTCSRIQIGTRTTDHLNLNPSCPIHGEKSAWFNSDEQVQLRKQRSDRLRDLFEQAKIARNKNDKTL